MSKVKKAKQKATAWLDEEPKPPRRGRARKPARSSPASSAARKKADRGIAPTSKQPLTRTAAGEWTVRNGEIVQVKGGPAAKKPILTAALLAKGKRVLLANGDGARSNKAIDQPHHGHESEPRIESIKLLDDTKRLPSMIKSLIGRSRCWATDGEYVAFRRKLANPATLQRHENFLKLGNYKHITTQDDVELYKLMEGSPFKRTPVNLMQMNDSNMARQAILAACARDWGLFIDILTELSGRIKGRWGLGGDAFALQAYQAMLGHIFNMILMRRGPSQGEIDAGVRGLREKRGEGSRLIMLPPPRA